MVVYFIAVLSIWQHISKLLWVLFKNPKDQISFLEIQITGMEVDVHIIAYLPKSLRCIPPYIIRTGNISNHAKILKHFRGSCEQYWKQNETKHSNYEISVAILTSFSLASRNNIASSYSDLHEALISLLISFFGKN